MWWIIAWFACGIFTWGWGFAFFREPINNKSCRDYRNDLIECSLLSLLFWPLFAPTLIYAKRENHSKLWYGWRLW
jgi:hypothetical protein